MVKATDLVLIAGVLGLGAFAINKFGNNAEERQDGQTARTDLRTDSRIEKTIIRQEEKTDRVEIRNETVKNIVDTVKNIGSGGGHSTSVYIPPTVKIKTTVTPTTQSNKSPFLTNSSSTANMSLATGGTGTGTNVLKTLAPAKILTTKEPTLFQKFMGVSPTKTLTTL